MCDPSSHKRSPRAERSRQPLSFLLQPPEPSSGLGRPIGPSRCRAVFRPRSPWAAIHLCPATDWQITCADARRHEGTTSDGSGPSLAEEPLVGRGGHQLNAG